MKKLLALMLAAALALSLAACGGDDKNQKATIITNEGETVEMTAEELMAAYDSNEVKFNKLYQYAEINFTGTIDSIKTDTLVIVENGSVHGNGQKIVFKEGWCLVVFEEDENIQIFKGTDNLELADLDSGDIVKVKTGIVGAPFDTEYIKSVCDNNRVVWLVGMLELSGGWLTKDPFQRYGTVTTVIEKLN